jgi:hypothetical protein
MFLRAGLVKFKDYKRYQNHFKTKSSTFRLDRNFQLMTKS